LYTCPEAVIFDFDGVIVDSEPLHYQAFTAVLEPLGLGFSWQDYCDVYMGFDDRDAFREAFRAGKKQLAENSLEQLIAQKAEVFQQIITAGVPPYPGVMELVRHLYEQGIPIAICSGALLSDIKPVLRNLGITDCFSCIITAEDVSQSKPDPACYCLAFEKLRKQHPQLTVPSKTCAIEDTPAGIAAAKGANLQVVAVKNSYPAEQLQQADIILEELTELPAAFGRLQAF